MSKVSSGGFHYLDHQRAVRPGCLKMEALILIGFGIVFFFAASALVASQMTPRLLVVLGMVAVVHLGMTILMVVIYTLMLLIGLA